MKILITFVLLIGATCCLAQTGTVVLVVEGIKQKKGGELSAGIFAEKSFPKVGKQLLGKEVKIEGASTMTMIMNDVPIGQYGVAVFQDIDKNKDLKTNFIGLPQEPIGFSNDARINFGPPSFEDAKFTVEANKEIKLRIILR
jgi:uncharacterized protein (DUF2141 family)